MTETEDKKFCEAADLSDGGLFSLFGNYGQYVSLIAERKRLREKGYNIPALPSSIGEEDGRLMGEPAALTIERWRGERIGQHLRDMESAREAERQAAIAGAIDKTLAAAITEGMARLKGEAEKAIDEKLSTFNAEADRILREATDKIQSRKEGAVREIRTVGEEMRERLGYGSE